MGQQNQYDYLKIDCLDDIEPVEAIASWTITDSRDETVTITNAVLPDGHWVYGYNVYWANGRMSATGPTAKFGKFRSQREARLHAIGFMKMFLPHFIQDTRNALRHAENTLLQGELF